jgi:hypothetical protein
MVHVAFCYQMSKYAREGVQWAGINIVTGPLKVCSGPVSILASPLKVCSGPVSILAGINIDTGPLKVCSGPVSILIQAH